ncbi:hypothetical protein [Geomonas ferrireducens]|uniref:hypothetical protein n=1 Tax=Geomonas ferrireducens TaxID=2570227 RepID=UPI0010A9081B|nr:hypothetical protein [Geomonas ferrireducens]
MSASKLFWLCIFTLLITVSGSQGAATDPLSKANRLPASLEMTVQGFQGAVLQEGYEVARGYWRLWGADDCKLPLQSVGFCYGNNPTAPYVLAVVPPWKDEFVDRSLQHALVQGQRGMAANYRLGEREALVIIAQMPPPARYFGMGTNVFTRQTELNKSDPVYAKLDTPSTLDLLYIIFGASPDPTRMMMIASFGDTINNVMIDNQSAGVWGEPRYFVITADEQMATAMTGALEKAGVDKSLVFTEPAGFVDPDNAAKPQLLRLGYGPEADDFITYIRYSMPNDTVLGEKWREELPLTILRVRAPNGGQAQKPYKIQQYETKSWNFDESALQGDLNSLVAAVKSYWRQDGAGQRPDAPAAQFKSLTGWVDLVGQHCLGYDGPPPTDPAENITLPRGPMNCLGDNMDDEPQISAGTYRLDEGQVIAVVGTLGTKTGNATYTSLAVNWFPQLVGVLNSDDPVLEESAERFKGALSDPQLYKKFYVYYYARDCSGLYPFCEEVPRQLVPAGDTIKILQRNYMTPGSTRGPDPLKVLAPFSIQFDGTKGMRPAL